MRRHHLLIFPILSLPLLLGGCPSSAPPADVIKALAADPNSLCWTVSSIYFSSSFDRNHGCGTASAPVVVVSPSPTPSHVEVIRP